ncbi:monofunctional biosynthetic peptidoglycan transglycosylase [Christiangramia sp. SM2212]|uniref:Biosynthetic peptidoglycan transglycosylase n=1 Tax=Christiangramia sediminicola TaxID=3073267 RepID=A0ABU1ET35_9FLAO|nr:monofunctional biosynthetic peptidoglycan transglycosylase [Christiangramia sp. SM2212]MDR5591308.1 monofunctional biosynthetic peptidoglycan transglycosylase [Christiangramia sp. SM2212]
MIKKFFRFIFKLLLGLFLFSILIVVVYKWVPVPFTPLMAIRYFENSEEPVEHEWVPIENISRHLQLAVISSEDQNFTKHSGFDFESIQKAMEDNRSGRKVRGASTISQQTAKNVFLFPSRTWFRKGLEAYFTFLIEIIWSKERILEVYLNSIEMGKGVYGAQAASQHWFKKDAANLSAYEAAAIASVLPNPREYRANPASDFIQRRKNWIVRQMQNYGKFILD